MLILHFQLVVYMNETIILLISKEVSIFIKSLSRQAADKIYYNMHRVSLGEKNNELFKKLENSEIWEFRTLYNKISYRIFAFWDNDENALIVTTHGIIKKSNKTPKKDIEKAERSRLDYFNNKR